MPSWAHSGAWPISPSSLAPHRVPCLSHQLRTLKQARLVKFQRDGKNVIYSLSDDHVYTMLSQGLTHICE